MMEALFESDRFQQFVGARLRSAPDRSVSNIGIWTFSSAVKVGQQMKGLEDETDLVRAIGGEIRAIRRVIRPILQCARRSAGRARRAFGAAWFFRNRWADDRDKLALPDAKIDAAQRVHLPVVVIFL